MGQFGFFDADRRLAAISAKGDPLEMIARVVPFESFRGEIEAAVLTPVSAAELQAAIIEALDRNVPHPSAIRLALERRRHDRQQLPPVAVNLPEHVQARDVPVRPPRLEHYDQIKRSSDE